MWCWLHLLIEARTKRLGHFISSWELWWSGSVCKVITTQFGTHLWCYPSPFLIEVPWSPLSDDCRIEVAAMLVELQYRPLAGTMYTISLLHIWATVTATRAIHFRAASFSKVLSHVSQRRLVAEDQARLLPSNRDLVHSMTLAIKIEVDK